MKNLIFVLLSIFLISAATKTIASTAATFKQKPYQVEIPRRNDLRGL